MPYVTVVFDPIKIPQPAIDLLKSWLHREVAETLSNHETLDVTITPEVSTELALGAIETLPEEIMVTQHAVHPTDVNVPPLEIYIQAGRSKSRSGDKVVQLLGAELAKSMLIPAEYLGYGLSGIFITFHESNGFGFIPRLN